LFPAAFKLRTVPLCRVRIRIGQCAIQIGRLTARHRVGNAEMVGSSVCLLHNTSGMESYASRCLPVCQSVCRYVAFNHWLTGRPTSQYSAPKPSPQCDVEVYGFCSENGEIWRVAVRVLSQRHWTFWLTRSAAEKIGVGWVPP
jgi:hypothetical protein